MGGLIVRQALGANNYIETVHGQHIEVSTVVMIAPPNAGSYASDFALEWDNYPYLLLWEIHHGFAYGLTWDSTRDLKTSNVRAFSRAHPWPDAVRLRMLAATATNACQGDLWFGNNWTQAQLKSNGIEQSPEIYNDGVVTHPSVDGDYYEVHSTDALITLSRNSTFKTTKGSSIPASVTDSQVTGGQLDDHLSVLLDSNIVKAVGSVLTGSSWPIMAQSPANLAQASNAQQQAFQPSCLSRRQGRWRPEVWRNLR